MIKVKATKRSEGRGNKELAKEYKRIIESKEVEGSFLSPGSYTLVELLSHAKDNEVYRPLAKSFGLVK